VVVRLPPSGSSAGPSISKRVNTHSGCLPPPCEAPATGAQSGITSQSRQSDAAAAVPLPASPGSVPGNPQNLPLRPKEGADVKSSVAADSTEAKQSDISQGSGEDASAALEKRFAALGGKTSVPSSIGRTRRILPVVPQLSGKDTAKTPAPSIFQFGASPSGREAEPESSFDFGNSTSASPSRWPSLKPNPMHNPPSHGKGTGGGASTESLKCKCGRLHYHIRRYRDGDEVPLWADDGSEDRPQTAHDPNVTTTEAAKPATGVPIEQHPAGERSEPEPCSVPRSPSLSRRDGDEESEYDAEAWETAHEGTESATDRSDDTTMPPESPPATEGSV
jgi:hypothetical protein